MLHLKQWLYHQRRQMAVIGSLAFATAVCVALLAVRAVYARSGAHFGLLWNLGLAWLPMLSALAAYNLGRRRQRGLWLLIAPCLAFWLLFFPNAPYILTDILHLQPQTGVPLWYDLILLVTFAWTGAFLGLVSLYLMQSLVRRAAGTWGSWVFTLAVLGLTGFGVYLGRFPRWNSWDMLTDPLSLLLDIATRLRHPLAYSRTFVFSALFSLCLAAMYFMLTAIIQLRPEEWGEAVPAQHAVDPIDASTEMPIVTHNAGGTASPLHNMRAASVGARQSPHNTPPTRPMHPRKCQS